MRVGSLRNAERKWLRSSVSDLNGWKKGVLIGSVIGFFSLLIIYSLGRYFENFALAIMSPIRILTFVIMGFPSYGGVLSVFLYIVLSTIIYGMMGGLIGFIISRIKRRGA